MEGVVVAAAAAAVVAVVVCSSLANSKSLVILRQIFENVI